MNSRQSLFLIEWLSCIIVLSPGIAIVCIGNEIAIGMCANLISLMIVFMHILSFLVMRIRYTPMYLALVVTSYCIHPNSLPDWIQTAEFWYICHSHDTIYVPLSSIPFKYYSYNLLLKYKENINDPTVLDTTGVMMIAQRYPYEVMDITSPTIFWENLDVNARESYYKNIQSLKKFDIPIDGDVFNTYHNSNFYCFMLSDNVQTQFTGKIKIRELCLRELSKMYCKFDEKFCLREVIITDTTSVHINRINNITFKPFVTVLKVTDAKLGDVIIEYRE